MLSIVGTAADRHVARRNAAAIASSIGSKARSHRKQTLGEPECPYEVRWNTDEFWFGVQVSDSAFVVRGNHKTRFSVDIGFYASLKQPDSSMCTKVRLESLSKDLGTSVFVADVRFGPAASQALRAAPVRSILSSINFDAVLKLFLSPVQIYAIANYATPQVCVEQAGLLRRLLTALFEWNKNWDA